MYVRVRYRWQKNGEHGQSKWQSRNKERKKLYSVSAWIRIVQQYSRLKTDKIKNEPLADFFNNMTKRNSNIVASKAAQLIKHLAKITYDETDTKELSKYFCHSLQVGACCSLYTAGFDEAHIKKLLRWKSDTWMDYVCNMIVTIIQHNMALNSVDNMPLI